MMKAARLVAVLLIATVVFSLCGCRKVEEKIAEKGAEKLIEDALGVDVDISEDGGEIKVDGGAMEAGEDLPWPKEAMGDMPKPEGKITFIMKDDETKGCTVTVSELETDNAKQYVEELKKMGYKETMRTENEDGILFMGGTDKGEIVNFAYNYSDKQGVVAYSPEDRYAGMGVQPAAEMVNDGDGSGSPDVSRSEQAGTVKFPENYPASLFPVNKEDVVMVAREHEFEDGIEYSLILESQKSTEEIVEYYEDKWGPIENTDKAVSATSFELYVSIKGYEVSINGSVSDEDPKKVEYYIYIIELKK
ncbi:MAG TPA: hypothetical protein VEG39_13855 [Clostridia bacterium]|nr:hypothetical protein [Clostridia bacterium]